MRALVSPSSGGTSCPAPGCDGFTGCTIGQVRASGHQNKSRPTGIGPSGTSSSPGGCPRQTRSEIVSPLLRSLPNCGGEGTKAVFVKRRKGIGDLDDLFRRRVGSAPGPTLEGCGSGRGDRCWAESPERGGRGRTPHACRGADSGKIPNPPSSSGSFRRRLRRDEVRNHFRVWSASGPIELDSVGRF
jgi:hypothetical protein